MTKYLICYYIDIFPWILFPYLLRVNHIKVHALKRKMYQKDCSLIWSTSRPMFSFQNPHGISQQYEASIRLSHAAFLHIDNDSYIYTYIVPLGLFRWLSSENLFLYINLRYIHCSFFFKKITSCQTNREYYLVISNNSILHR